MNLGKYLIYEELCDYLLCPCFTERNWHMWLPGFGTDELRPYKRAPTTEAHKQRLALIRKAIKKYQLSGQMQLLIVSTVDVI